MEGKSLNRKWKLTLQVAATYIGTVVGAGFATGKEIVQFFTQYGVLGMLGILVSGLLFIWLGARMMLIAQDIGASSYQELNDHLFGKTIGKGINFFMVLVLIGMTSIMLASTGAIAKEHLGIWPQAGMVITMLAVYALILKGVKGLLLVNSLVVPTMLTFSLIVIWPYLGEFTMFKQEMFESASHTRWFVSAILYAAFNLAGAQAALVPLSTEIKDKSVVKWGAVLGGIGLTFMMLTAHFAISHFPHAFQAEIPMGQVVKSSSVWLGWLFLLVVYGEIFTTLIANVFGMARQAKGVLRISEKQCVGFVLILCFVIGQIGYGRLLSVLYPIFGYVGLGFLIMLAFHKNKIISK